MMRHAPHISCFLVVLAVCCQFAHAQSASPDRVVPQDGQQSAATRLQANKSDRNQLSFDLDSVGKLIESSSAARQIEASRSADAQVLREAARNSHRNARSALEAGNLERAAALLTDARGKFFEAVRLAAPEEVVAKKNESDYRNRLDSVNALLGAYKRVASEKGRPVPAVNETVARIEQYIAQASGLADQRKFKEGLVELDRAYLVAKAGVSSLRSGDTLVRSLNFANKEEEYHYEVDRNDTHQMLIKMLVDEKRSSNAVLDQQVAAFLDKARSLRTAAESAAGKGDHGRAVMLLEESTAELVRAIRNAGIYIPG